MIRHGRDSKPEDILKQVEALLPQKTITSINQVNKEFAKKLETNVKFSPSPGVAELHFEIGEETNGGVGADIEVQAEDTNVGVEAAKVGIASMMSAGILGLFSIFNDKKDKKPPTEWSHDLIHQDHKNI